MPGSHVFHPLPDPPDAKRERGVVPRTRSSLRGGEADAVIQSPRRQSGLPRCFAPRNDGVQGAGGVRDMNAAVTAFSP